MLVRNGAHMDARDKAGESPVGILGDLWPGVLEGQGEDVKSARVPPLRCLAAHAVLAAGVEYHSGAAGISSFIDLH